MEKPQKNTKIYSNLCIFPKMLISHPWDLYGKCLRIQKKKWQIFRCINLLGNFPMEILIIFFLRNWKSSEGENLICVGIYGILIYWIWIFFYLNNLVINMLEFGLIWWFNCWGNVAKWMVQVLWECWGMDLKNRVPRCSTIKKR
jgi:hypothetical protein